jgi:hypothetical protein
MSTNNMTIWTHLMNLTAWTIYLTIWTHLLEPDSLDPSIRKGHALENESPKCWAWPM